MVVVLIVPSCEKFRQREPPGRYDLRNASDFLPFGTLLVILLPSLFGISVLESLLWVKTLLLLWVPIRKQNKTKQNKTKLYLKVSPYSTGIHH